MALALSSENLKNQVLNKAKGNKTSKPDLLSGVYSILGIFP